VRVQKDLRVLERTPDALDEHVVSMQRPLPSMLIGSLGLHLSLTCRFASYEILNCVALGAPPWRTCERAHEN
jgi:hypothetical protein